MTLEVLKSCPELLGRACIVAAPRAVLPRSIPCRNANSASQRQIERLARSQPQTFRILMIKTKIYAHHKLLSLMLPMNHSLPNIAVAGLWTKAVRPGDMFLHCMFVSYESIESVSLAPSSWTIYTLYLMPPFANRTTLPISLTAIFSGTKPAGSAAKSVLTMAPTSAM